ncbi:MAG: hypothetical protein HON76_03210 [Candidatus Scalindua sp.]|jgi:hypothetical protein|nr:hypothetical protein [Candidatus Scalindua sp.]MBT5305734.1 hypothetical protein [Candidatus Scalindua sp.]MBT6052146.1 hypothetical protein [Candidatus Scalindua sp.]MBT6561521.1 hypothetical protein [Candidatus Scalindua sp.]MBT7210944.1 hypothetical protein [Candidatus Scalindua sp.]
MFKNSLLVVLVLLVFASQAFAVENRTKQVLETADFGVDQVLNDVYALVDSENVNLFDQRNEDMDRELIALFDVSILRSKLEQFYTMLYHISSFATIAKDEFTIDRDLTIKLLISSRVFTDRDFPQNISNVYLSRKNREKPSYKVSFSSERVELGLNYGDGYGIAKVGMNQEAQALVFYGAFSFKLRKKGENVEAYDFDGVDLYGNFGSRGFINVDINYVAVKSVEFHKASEMALVKAKVSRREFEINNHTWLLGLVTRFVTDKSLQPLDW